MCAVSAFSEVLSMDPDNDDGTDVRIVFFVFGAALKACCCVRWAGLGSCALHVANCTAANSAASLPAHPCSEDSKYAAVALSAPLLTKLLPACLFVQWGSYPPVAFMRMERDQDTNDRIARNQEVCALFLVVARSKFWYHCILCRPTNCMLHRLQPWGSLMLL